jgi:PAS domain S-box-containing protein
MANQDFSGFGSIPDAVLVVGRDGSIVFANEHAERLFGFEQGKLVGLSVEALVPERHRQRHRQLRGGFSADPGVRPMGSGRELFALRSDGHEFPVEIAIGPSESGECVVAVVRDITALLATREQLAASEERFEGVVQSLGSHLAVLNRAGEIIAVNRAWVDFGHENGSGSKSAVGVGANYLETCRLAADDDPDAQRALAGIRSILDGSQTTFAMDYPCHGPAKKRWFSMRVTPMGSKTGAVVMHTDVTERALEREKLERTLADVRQLKDQLKSESQILRAELKSEHDFEEIIGDSEPMMVTLHKVESVASTDSTVLILGETGTGKELLARAIHDRSKRRDRPLVKIDCTTLPSGLVESELFGHQKGAFTGAYESKAGRFELADGGTVFLDEVGELSIDVQAKLLRVIQEGEFQRLGSKRVQKTDIRLIAATNRDLRIEIREGRFRSDLYYRLGVFLIESPPLRDRREDIPLLVSYFVAKFSTSVGRRFDSVAQSSMDALMAYDWPGNVRELQNVIERSVVLCPAGTLHVREVFGDSAAWSPASKRSLKHDLQNVERSNILRALGDSGWKVKGEGNAASRLGLKPSTLQSRMKTLGITRP